LQRQEIQFEHVGAKNLHRDEGFDAELAAILAASKGIHFAMLGSRPPEFVLPEWDVFVLPSRSEAFPLATLEAMATGLPVIATDVGGVSEQIRHMQTGILVPADDVEAIASWLVRLHDEPALRRRLGDAASAFVRSTLTLEQQAAGLHRAYLMALSARFGPPALRPREAAAT
jgi:glycosyltransferase involved in cell wall biosynthesis